MIEVAQLTKTYGSGPTAVRALGGVDMAVPDGEFVAIMGPSGSGKSTLLHILGALEAPSGGTVAVAGRHYEGLDDAAQILRLLRELNRDEGRTIVMVTHDPAAAAMADRVVFVRDGLVAGEVPGGSTDAVIEFFATLQPALAA